ncbi:hypothetical protein HO173_011459 [Letharia columbiana]|uniref:Large ribosomal subunit protein bL17m n=1 Tax=Letharia columbiana TaxID=112416 RepID=A0A8H6KZ51_9LECA|nr:uncharacterized protein HO173_011459 [Letharia columbiana]KAF6229604.1 hypothetical protein HO173_011459 [Letharia columbiana]
MAGGALKYRHLDRKSSHRQALLRNLVTSLITHESIKTTWPKAKEAQRLAEKLITLGKKNTNASRARAESIFFEPLKHLPTLFTTLRQRYLNRPGGYTRVLRIEPLNRNNDQAPSAILELVDGPRDMRFAMTAKTLVRERANDGGIREITARNVAKVTRFREDGEAELEKTVRRLETMKGLGKEDEEEDEEEESGEREPWEPFPRMKQREREKEDEERPFTEREKMEKKRTKRDPNTGRRVSRG